MKHYLLTIELFEAQSYNYSDTDGDTFVQYEGVVWNLDTLKQHDGMVTAINDNGDVYVYDNNGETVANFNMLQVAEFITLLTSKFNQLPKEQLIQ